MSSNNRKYVYISMIFSLFNRFKTQTTNSLPISPQLFQFLKSACWKSRNFTINWQWFIFTNKLELYDTRNVLFWLKNFENYHTLQLIIFYIYFYRYYNFKVITILPILFIQDHMFKGLRILNTTIFFIVTVYLFKSRFIRCKISIKK